MTTPRRWVVPTAIAVGVAALHAAVLLLWGPSWFEPDDVPGSAAAVTLRSVELPPLQPPPEQRLEAAVVAPPIAVPVRPRAALPRRAASAPTLLTATTPAVPVSPPDIGPQAAAVEVIDVPVYATKLPPSGRWRYRLQRGVAIGEAELQWSPAADSHYELRLEGRVAGVTLLDWVSQGQIDAAGIAPERFAVRRRGRDRQAANFQREAAKITFSGPTHELPLLPGSQDRLSWLLQLPAIVAAAPERFASGASVVLFVAGARGDANVWTFTVHGTETVDDTPALKLVREPRSLYDTRVEVWLDPAANHLPLRAVQTPSGGGAALELTREREER